MSAKGNIATAGVVLGILVFGIIGVAIYLVDSGTVVVGLDTDYCALPDMDSDGKRAGGMEMRGHWNGMGLAGPGTQTAVRLGHAGRKEGVIVAHIDPDTGISATQAGLKVGDVIIGVDKQKVRNLVDLHSVSRQLQPCTPALLDVDRGGQVVTLVVPTDPAPQSQVVGGLPVAAGSQMVCPRDGTLVPAAQAQATGGVCPLCNGGLQPVAPNAGAVQ